MAGEERSGGEHRRTDRSLAPYAAAAGQVVIFIVALTIPLGAAEDLGLTREETAGWIMGVYAIPGVLTIALVLRHRQPLVMTGNIFLLIFVASLGAEIPWPELVGAAMVAGVVVLIIGPLGITDWISRWLPPPIVYGLLAGAILHFVVDLFTATGDEPFMVGLTLATYLLARRYLEPRIPALLPAIVVGIIAAIALGETGAMPTNVELVPAVTAPELSLQALLTVTPVMVVLVTVQANVPSVVYLRREGYQPPDSTVNVMSGAGSTVGSLLGPVGVSLSLPASALCGGPDAGALDQRHRAAFVAGAALIVIGAAAGLATAIAEVLPRPLLVALVGLAVLGILLVALQSFVQGPLTLGPLFAFAIAQSNLELLELGPFFWALAGGVLVSLLLETESWPKPVRG